MGIGPGLFAVILPAAGRSTRFGVGAAAGTPKKIFADLDGKPVWLRSLEAFVGRPDVAQVVVAISPNDRATFEGVAGDLPPFVRFVEGGAERADSIAAALAVVDPACAFVAVHDAARPCLDPALIDRVFDGARRAGATVPALAVTDTLKRVEGGLIVATVPRAGLWAVQTPQAFRRDWLVAAYRLRDRPAAATDDATLVEALGHPCTVVAGSPTNIKITHPDDLRLAAAYLALRTPA